MASQYLPPISSEKPLMGNQRYHNEEDQSYKPPAPNATPVRRNANYELSHWNYQRIQSLAIDPQDEYQKLEKNIEKLRHEVVILLSTTDLFEQIELVDLLGQLGVAYHFEKEIQDILTSVELVIDSSISKKPDDLPAISQLFRVLRSYGFTVSQDIFKSFRDEKGGFKAGLCLDHKGMLSLYEASFLGMVDEGIMDEAREFTAKELHELQKLSSLDEHFMFQLAYALELPIHHRMRKLHSRWFIETYEKMDSVNPVILELAKQDFNAIRNMYVKELKELSRWWNNLSLVGENMTFFRCRLMEAFFWALGIVPEPELQRCRAALTKLICLATLFDDCYDIYGTLDELELFTEAIQRWDTNIIKELPKCMKMCFLAMLNFINDLGYEVLRDKGVEVIPILKKSVVALCNGYYQEAKWYHTGYIPSTEEYINNAWVSTVGPTLATFSYCTSEDITNEVVQQYELLNGMIRSSCIISRLLDDLVTAMPEMARGDVPKYIQCYMFENGASEAMAIQHVKEVITENWKELNSYNIPKSVGVDTYGYFLLGLPRASHIIYQFGDGYGEPNKETKERIKSLMNEPIPY